MSSLRLYLSPFKGLILSLASLSFHLSSISAGTLCPEKVAQFRNYFKSLDLHQGLGYRGLLSTEPKLSPESRIAGFAEGLNYWGARILVANSIEAARTRDQKERNPLLKAFFLIGEDTNLESLSQEQRKLEFAQLIQKGIYWFENDELQHLNASQASLFSPELVDPTEFEKVDGKPEFGFILKGWFFTKLRGVIRYSEVEKSSTYKNKIRRASRSYLRRGFRVTFNQAFNPSLEKVANQIRQDGGSTRYSESYKAMLRGLFEAGYAYSIEVWSPDHRLLAGNVGLRFGNLFKGDSVFYEVNEGESHVELARMAVNALIDRLHDHGVDVIDIGMVTGFTQYMKGEYIPGTQFLEILRDLQSTNRNIDFNSPWTWKEETAAKTQAN